MGLTIHYTLTARRGMTCAFIKRLLYQTQRLARKNGCAYVGKVLAASESDPDAPPFFDCRPGRERRLHYGGPRTDGWLLEVWPGEGCETVVLGLCRAYRLSRRPKNRRILWLPRYEEIGWRMDAFCKTCYAAEHGREHFVQCHERVIQLLDLWRDAGVRVEVHDEGGFWKSRSREKLAAQLGDPKRVRQIVCE